MRRVRAGFVVLVTVVATLAHPGAEAAEGPIGEVYRTASKRARAGEQTSLRVACPKDRPVLSGGVLVSGTATSLSVASNGPTDGPDADRKPDDAWKAAVNNGSAQHDVLSVYVQCGARSDRPYLQYLSRTTRIPPAAGGGNRVDCPPPLKVTGGGLIVSGRTMNAPITSTMPFDGTDPGSVRDDTWVTHMLNESGKAVRQTATTICADPNALGELGGTMLTVFHENNPIAGNDQESADADCPANHVGGGGGG